MTPRTANAGELDPTDEELAARRDLAALYDRYAHRLVPFLSSLRVARSDLEDVQQEVWTRVWIAFGKATFDGHFRGWLFTIARHLVIDRGLRRRVVDTQPADDSLPARTRTPHEELTCQETQTQLARCLEHLEQREAEVFRSMTGGEEYNELCPRLGITRESAYKLFFRAKCKLVSCLERADR
jgi:RNA polymerase sigma-70 factor (ECF subfamily)